MAKRPLSSFFLYQKDIICSAGECKYVVMAKLLASGGQLGTVSINIVSIKWIWVR
jgi:hypothetical protein